MSTPATSTLLLHTEFVRQARSDSSPLTADIGNNRPILQDGLSHVNTSLDRVFTMENDAWAMKDDQQGRYTMSNTNSHTSTQQHAISDSDDEDSCPVGGSAGGEDCHDSTEAGKYENIGDGIRTAFSIIDTDIRII